MGLPRFRIGVIEGDGIGPELVEAALTVASAAVEGEAVLAYHQEAGGAKTYAETGEPLSAAALERIRSEYDATLKGPVGLPTVRKPDGTEGGLLGGVLRGGLDAYANVRPIASVPGVRTPMRPDLGPIDYVIVRENTEGLYLSRGLGVGNDHASADHLMMTRHGVERVVHRAFGLARARTGAPADRVRRVTCVDKSNVIRSYAFFRRIFTEIAPEYPDIETDFRYADAAGHDLVHDPGHFDVLVMENFLGDILSDVGAATIGGLGLCPSGNIGDTSAYFEPIHGSAPDLAGQDRANPVSQLLSAAMMLDHLGLAGPAGRVRRAVREVFAGGEVTLDARGRPTCGTRAVAERVRKRLV
ncbi:isocitrate/isopropylmalate dehydrogenase family protein [Streptomyces odontomachi]|uniref:isocitrate/isopropylmalate dehydrogenase family protein n=1 Tax=Streptomyces odontomachi TaxID=2944940 RepID=UPI00210BFC2E|nr:isocitrate/isopropylmalate family dehydrogenase [Streptomyces sp. ODS25]